jgi:hypothetical protein
MKPLSQRFVNMCCCAFAALLVFAGSANAQQDSIKLSHHYQSDGTCCWDFSIKNANTQSLAINRIELFVVNNDQTTFNLSSSADLTWSSAVSSDGRTATYTAGGSSINAGSTKGGFSFCLFNIGIDANPESVQLTTFQNTTPITRTNLSLICTPFQSENKLDTVTVVPSQAGTDPCFRFKVFNRNDLGSAIDQMIFETLDPAEGVIRPSSVRAPQDWQLDSVTPNRVYFSTSIKPLDPSKSLDNFLMCLYGNSTFTKFGWVWRALTGNILIDRDTIRNIPATASASTSGSADEVTATNKFGCLYTINLKNYHVTGRNLPSRLTGLTLNSSTSGVTIASAPTVPAHWAKSISSHSDTVIFQAGSDSDGLASGLTLSDFGISINNPSGNAFTLHWQSIRGSSTISSGDLNLTCSVGAALNDTALIDPNGNCCYKLTVQNRHNSPPSNDYGLSLAITDGSGTFDTTAGSLHSSQFWASSASPNSTSVRLTGNSTNFQPSGASQTVFFCVRPKVSGQPVNIQYVTYDAANTATAAGQNFGVTCSNIVTTCDSVRFTTANQGSCLQSLSILNRRATSVTKVVVSPLMGWKVDTAFAPLPWTTKVDPSKLFVTFSASPGISSNSEQTGFNIAFSGQRTSSTFGVEVATTNDAGVCLDTLKFTCAPSGVSEMLGQSSSIKLVANPNPFHNGTELTLTMPAAAKASVEVIDLLGRSVMVISNELLTQGEHVFHLDASSLPAGTYYVRVQSLVGLSTKKIVLAK